MSGKNILIAGTGFLGENLAYNLLVSGNTVIINSRNGDKLKEMKNELSKFGNIDYLARELKDEESCRQLIDNTVQKLQNIDSIVIMIGGYVEDSIDTLDGLDLMILNHIKIPLYLAKYAARKMKYGSSIIFLSNSSADSKNKKNLLSYTIAKSAINRATKILAAELLDRGIRINTVAPEYIIQEFKPENSDVFHIKFGELETPPAYISDVINYLINGQSRWINGAIIPVDGGHSLK